MGDRGEAETGLSRSSSRNRNWRDRDPTSLRREPTLELYPLTSIHVHRHTKEMKQTDKCEARQRKE